MIIGLKRARALLEENGWVGPEREPMCSRSDGSWCLQDDEGLAKYSVGGVLVHVFGPAGYPEAWQALQVVVSPARAAWERFLQSAGEPSTWTTEQQREGWKLERAARVDGGLEVWLREPTRTERDVLGKFTEAIAQAKKAARAA